MTKKRVAVLRGGPSTEYDVSMQTGAGVISALNRLGYHVIDIPVSKQGEWIIDGRVKSPDKALLTTDVVFIAMHGAYGEDGTVQRICERHHIPFTGSSSFPSSVAFNKDVTKRALREVLPKMPKHVRVTREHERDLLEVVKVVERSFGPEYVVKPSRNGSSHGVTMTGGGASLLKAVHTALRDHDECLVEERIRGVEATCAILEDFRDTSHYVLPPIEIVPPQNREFFDLESKYNGTTAEICPGRFSYEEKQRIADLALLVHQTLGLTQYSRTDCIVRDGEVYFLEVNTLPGLTSESLFPKAAAAVGLPFDALIDHLIKTARVY